jgi:preprotein translocase subunit SecE
MSGVTEFPEDEGRSAGGPGDGEGGGGRSLKLPRLPWGRRIVEFYHNVKLEMGKTTWPNRSDVWNTTVVVLIAVVFFGFYLFGVDRLVALGFQYLEKAIR